MREDTCLARCELARSEAVCEPAHLPCKCRGRSWSFPRQNKRALLIELGEAGYSRYARRYRLWRYANQRTCHASAVVEVGASLVKTKSTPCGVLFCFGGGSWIRTSEVSDNRFTVCPLWPLGNSPKKYMELVIGVEPTTC